MKISWWDLGARVLVAVLGVAAIVAGCGGGVGEGGTGNGYTQGTISGFGSIFVNDVRFDDSSAAVQDADGNPRTRDDLKLGMTVEVESGAIDAASATATAAKVRFGSELLGPVATVDEAEFAAFAHGLTSDSLLQALALVEVVVPDQRAAFTARTGLTIRQLISDEINRNSMAYDRKLGDIGIDLNTLKPIGQLLNFCIGITDIHAHLQRWRGGQKVLVPAMWCF